MFEIVKGTFHIRTGINQEEQGATTNDEEWLISGLTTKHRELSFCFGTFMGYSGIYRQRANYIQFGYVTCMKIR